MKRYFCLLALLLMLPVHGWAFPNEEKGIIPPIGFPATSMAMDGDRFLFATFQSDQIVRIDTETFEPTTDQIPPLTDDDSDDTGDDLDGNIGGIAIQGRNLFATQDDGDLIIIDLDDITAEPEVAQISDASLGQIVADPEGAPADNLLYILDTQNNALLVVDSVTNEVMTSISFVDQNATIVSPVSIALAAIDGSPDKAYVTTNSGTIFVVDEGATTAVGPISVSADGTFVNQNLPSAAATPDGDFVLVVNSSDESVHVFDTTDNSQVDIDSGETGNNPIDLAPNSGLRQILIIDVLNPLVGSSQDIYAYVTGNDGISVIDLNIGASFNDPEVIDFNDQGTGDDDNDPMLVSATPLTLAASSPEDGYVYCSQNDESIAVITENPFVEISANSLADGTLTTGGSFTLTFRSDEAGTFRVVVGGDSSGNGTEVASGTVPAPDTDVTTPEIAHDGSIFNEGTNRVFVFVTDEDENVGRDADDITVDTPPPAVEIRRTNFGNEKVFVTFTRLNVSDIAQYNIFVGTDALSAATSTTVAASVNQPSSGDEVTASVEGLTNGVQVFLGVEAVDQGGTSGLRTTTFPDGTPVTATPEETVGLTGAVGETGCQLLKGGEKGAIWGGWLLMIPMILFLGLRRSKSFLFIFLFLIFSTPAFAVETPQWWSLEFKAGVWLPLDKTTKEFLGSVAPTGMIEFAFLYHEKFGAELGVGFTTLDGTSVGTISGAQSGDSFNLSLIPIYNSFVFRADFQEEQLLVPFVKAGPDYMVFRENSQGNVTSGIKYGLHTAAGLQILLDRIEDLSTDLEGMGINDVYFTIEGRYAWINDFGGNGLDLSNVTLTGGLLFEF